MSGGDWRIPIMVTIKYRNPRRPDEAGLMLVSDRSQVAEAKAGLARRGVVIVDDQGVIPPRQYLRKMGGARHDETAPA